MEIFLPISLKLNFSPNTVGCYGLSIHSLLQLYLQVALTIDVNNDHKTRQYFAL